MRLACKSIIDVYVVEALSPQRVRDKNRVSDKAVDPPGFSCLLLVQVTACATEEIPRMSPVYRIAFPSPSIRNITAPVQWLASRSVTRIETRGVSSISVGVSKGIGLYRL